MSLSAFFFLWLCPHRDLHFSLHDALPISRAADRRRHATPRAVPARRPARPGARVRRRELDGGGREHQVGPDVERSEEHTSELQSLTNLVCRLLLEKKKK